MAEPLVLVVGNDEVQRRVLRARIAAWGYRVTEAGASAEALAALTERPALILLDIDRWGSGVLQFTELLKVNAATAAIPIVAVTAHALEGDEEKILAAGCDGYVSKPIDPQRLLAFLRRHAPVGKD